MPDPGWGEAHGVGVEVGAQVVAGASLAPRGPPGRRPVVSQLVAEVEPADDVGQPAAHVGQGDLQAGIAVEDACVDHPGGGHSRVERASDGLFELVAVHPAVADRDHRRVEEDRRSLRLDVLPTRVEPGRVQDGPAPAGADADALGAQLVQAALAFAYAGGLVVE